MEVTKTAVGLAVLLTVGAANGQSCGSLENYDVQPTTYNKLPIADAVQKLLRGMPYQVQQRGLEEMLVSARDIAGPADKVMEALAKDAHIKYRRDRCVIYLQPADEDTWSIMSGATMKESMEQWAKRAGWQIDWAIDGDIQLTVAVTFQGTHERAVTELIEAMNQSGESLTAIFYAGNKTLRFTRTK